MKALKKILKGAIITYFIVSGLIVLSYAITSGMGWEYGRVLSGSMEPAIMTGDLVAIESVPVEDIRVGDIISFNMSGVSHDVVHRVINIYYDKDGSPYFQTKGDANVVQDRGLISAVDVNGRVIFRIPDCEVFAIALFSVLACLAVLFITLVIIEKRKCESK